LDIPAISTSKNAFHNGGKIVTCHDNNPYLTVGNIQRNTQNQNNKTGPNPDGSGGILRLTQEGKPTSDKILNNEYLDLYYAYIIRNSFGTDFDPVTGNLWDIENEPTYGDGINLVEPLPADQSLFTGCSTTNVRTFNPTDLITLMEEANTPIVNSYGKNLLGFWWYRRHRNITGWFFIHTCNKTIST
jgi:hypothetical protein